MTKLQAITTLGLKRVYTKEELKKTYRQLAKKYHPDLVGVAYTEKFARIVEAYELLDKLPISTGCVLTHDSIFSFRRVL